MSFQAACQFPKFNRWNGRSHLASLALKRVVPAESRKSAKVAVCRVDFRTVLKSNGSQVSIGGEIASCSHLNQQLPQQIKIARARLNDHYVGFCQPKSDQSQGLLDRKRFRQSPRAGTDSQEPEQNVPGKSDRFCSGDDPFQPGFGFFVGRRALIDGVNQQARSPAFSKFFGQLHFPSRFLVLKLIRQCKRVC